MNCIDHGRTDDKQVYASCRFNGRVIGKHVRALILHTGEQPNGRHALHDCDNPRCINPDHLHWGTNSDNRREAAERFRTQHGEDHLCAKLTEEQVREARALHVPRHREYSTRALARRYGVSQTAISYALNGKTWRSA